MFTIFFRYECKTIFSNIYTKKDRSAVLLFRGQSQDWKLKSSIENLLDELGYQYFWYIDERAAVNKSFRQEFIDNFKIKTGLTYKGNLHLLSLMQHYGLKTELLDVTESKDIGLFFACEKDFEQDGVLWAFNILSLYFCNVGNGIVKCNYKFDSDEIALDYSRKSLTNKAYYANFVCHCSLHDFQKEENLRVKRQKGKFLIAPNFWINKYFTSIENAIFSSYGFSRNSGYPTKITDIDYSIYGDMLIKFIIPTDVKRDCLAYLKNKNISQSYSFPEINEDARLRAICSNILEEFKLREKQPF